MRFGSTCPEALSGHSPIHELNASSRSAMDRPGAHFPHSRDGEPYDESVFAKAEQENPQRMENRLKAQAQALDYKQTKGIQPRPFVTGPEGEGATVSRKGGFARPQRTLP